MSILNELYEWYEMKTGCCMREGEAQKRFGEVWKKVEKVLGEELRGRIFDYMEEECSHDFQAGVRLGALLMQELQVPTAHSGASSAQQRLQ